MIRVEIIGEIKNRGVFGYRIPSLGLEGQSRQPLLDACRQIKSLLGDTGQRACLFRAGKSEPDISCSVAWGAAHTVKENPTVHFAKFQEFDRARLGEAAE
jgi:hypothetical protein